MTELTPDVQAIRSALLDAAHHDLQRRARQRQAARVSALMVAGVLALSGSALAAGELLGVIDLGGGLRAQPSHTFPAFDIATHRFVRVHTKNYLYHVTGGVTPAGLSCRTPNVGGSDIYIESSKPLTTSELQLAAEIAREGGRSPLVQKAGGLKAAFGDIPGLLSAGDGCGNPGNIERVVDGTANSAPAGGH